MMAESAGPDKRRLARSVSMAIDFLYGSQLPHGEFRTYSSTDEEMGEEAHFDSSPFTTSFVVYSVSPVGGTKVQEMTAKALGFLEEEMEGPGLWRYWSSKNPQHKLLPPDLDDTCCISFVLKQHGRTLPPNRAILLANRNREGVFHTWLVPRSISESRLADDAGYAVNPEALLVAHLNRVVDDVDCVANANALLYLGEDENTVGAVEYLVDIVLNGKEDGCSKFYPHCLSLYYMLSRACTHGVRSLEQVCVPVTDRVLRMQTQDGSFGNALLSALAVCTLHNFKGRPPTIANAVAHILDTQRKDGSWPRIPMFLGPAPYYGSEDLTTALCVEALAKCGSLLTG